MNRAQIVAILATAGASLSGPVTAQTIELARTLTGGDFQLAQAQIRQCTLAGDIVCCTDGLGEGQGRGEDINGGICSNLLLKFSSQGRYSG